MACSGRSLNTDTLHNHSIVTVLHSTVNFCCFRAAGEIFAVSLAQGGPAPKFLQEWCYEFLLTGNLENIDGDDVHDQEFSSLIQMVCKSTHTNPCN